MSLWKLSDGTVVRLGGRVSGSSELAAALRRDALAVKAGYGVPVQWDPPPGGVVPLDLGDAHVLDKWLRALARRFDAEVTEAPELQPLEGGELDEAEQDDDADEPGAIH